MTTSALDTTTSEKISGFAIEYIDRGIFKPKLDPNFYVPTETQELAEVIFSMSETTPQNVLMTGPQGCGKSEFGFWFAAKFDRPCFVMNCATIRETKDWFGYRDAKSGSILWHRSDFVRAIEKGNCVVILDEFNRLHTTLHNAVYPLLDARRSTFLEELGEIVKVNSGTVFIATANIGFSHVGTHTLDSALEDRFGFRIDIDFPNRERESEILVNKTGINKEMASKLAKFARDIRGKSTGVSATLTRAVSTRQLLQTAVLMQEFKKRKIDVKKAIDFTILPFYSKENGTESEQAQVLQLVQGIFTGTE